MNVNLQPRQFLFLYNSLKRIEIDFMDPEEEEVFNSTKQLLENFILDMFEEAESKALATGFDRWVKSETNKIQGLEESLKKIKETIPQEALTAKFTPVKKDTVRGRPKKKTK